MKFVKLYLFLLEDEFDRKIAVDLEMAKPRHLG
jgi:hypothetical protein